MFLNYLLTKRHIPQVLVTKADIVHVNLSLFNVLFTDLSQGIQSIELTFHFCLILTVAFRLRLILFH